MSLRVNPVTPNLFIERTATGRRRLNSSQLRPDDVVAFIDSPQEDVAEVNRADGEEEPPPLEIVCYRERALENER